MSGRVLVTGGTGFIGSAMVKGLLQRGYEVRVLDNNSRGASHRLSDVQEHVQIVRGDVRDAETVEGAARGCETIAHLAYVNGTEYFYRDPRLVLDVGVRGTLNVLDSAVRQGVAQFWLVSSSEVYQTPPTIPTDETVPFSIPDPLNPRYSYAGGKIIGELLALNYGRDSLDRVVVVRPHNVYGPDMGSEHVVPQFVERMMRLDVMYPSGVVPFPIQGSGAETRSFVYIDDFCDGALLAFEQGKHRGIYHVGTQDERTIAEVARTVADCFARKIRLVAGHVPEGSTLRRCPDITRVKSLGYEPRIAFEVGMVQTVDWYRRRVC